MRESLFSSAFLSVFVSGFLLVSSFVSSKSSAESKPSLYNLASQLSCNLKLECTITVDQVEAQARVDAFLESRGGFFSKDIEKKFWKFKPVRLHVQVKNPRVKFVEVEGVEMLETVVDLTMSSSNRWIPPVLLDDQVVTAKIQSRLHYNDSEWKIFAVEPEIIDVSFSKADKFYWPLKKPLKMVATSYAKKMLTDVPIFDFVKSGGWMTSVAGALLVEDGIAVEEGQLKIYLSPFQM